MKNSTVGKIAVVLGLLGAGAAGLYIKDRYFDRQESRQVKIDGLPCPSGNLVTPIWIEGTMDGYKFGMTYSGGASGTEVPRTVWNYLPAGKEHEVTVRIGQCHDKGTHFTCENPKWIGPKQIAIVDTRLPEPVLKLAMTNDHACR